MLIVKKSTSLCRFIWSGLSYQFSSSSDISKEHSIYHNSKWLHWWGDSGRSVCSQERVWSWSLLAFHNRSWWYEVVVQCSYEADVLNWWMEMYFEKVQYRHNACIALIDLVRYLIVRWELTSRSRGFLIARSMLLHVTEARTQYWETALESG